MRLQLDEFIAFFESARVIVPDTPAFPVQPPHWEYSRIIVVIARTTAASKAAHRQRRIKALQRGDEVADCFDAAE